MREELRCQRWRGIRLAGTTVAAGVRRMPDARDRVGATLRLSRQRQSRSPQRQTPQDGNRCHSEEWPCSSRRRRQQPTGGDQHSCGPRSLKTLRWQTNSLVRTGNPPPGTGVTRSTVHPPRRITPVRHVHAGTDRCPDRRPSGNPAYVIDACRHRLRRPEPALLRVRPPRPRTAPNSRNSTTAPMIAVIQVLRLKNVSSVCTPNSSLARNPPSRAPTIPITVASSRPAFFPVRFSAMRPARHRARSRQ